MRFEKVEWIQLFSNFCFLSALSFLIKLRKVNFSNIDWNEIPSHYFEYDVYKKRKTINYIQEVKPIQNNSSFL